MKKITIAILMLFSSYSLASAEIGVNVGVSGQMGVFTAEAEETLGSQRKGKDDGIGVFGYGSIFVEKTLGDYVSVGIDYVPSSLSTETAESIRRDKTTGAPAGAAKTQSVKVDLEDLTTIYLAVNLTENFYVKAGMMEVDVITKESLGTGGAYGNTSLDGTVLGMGYNKDLTNGMFVRAEGTYMDIDGVVLNSSAGETKSIKITDVGGASGKISIGKSF